MMFKACGSRGHDFGKGELGPSWFLDALEQFCIRRSCHRHRDWSSWQCDYEKLNVIPINDFNPFEICS